MGAIRMRFNKIRRAIGRASGPTGRAALQRISLAAVLAGSVTGCAHDIDLHGHLPDPDKVAEIKPGTTTKNDIIKLLGSPSSVSTFDDKTWYYISRRTEQIAFFQPKVLDQQVFIIDFSDSGVVQDVGHKDLADSRNIPMAPGATPAPGRELSFLEQLIGNVGKFGGSSGAAGQ
jgi:outer membrane protein assembly factor BamE (lipoprotein component of BamABCDE complex)